MSNRQSLDAWFSLVEKRELRVGIIGLGYVGLPLVLLFSEEGFRVTGFDIDGAKVDRLNRGESYIRRIEPEQIKSAQAKGFHATTDFAEIAEDRCHPDLRPHASQRPSHAGRQLHHRHDGFDCEPSPPRTAGGP